MKKPMFILKFVILIVALVLGGLSAKDLGDPVDVIVTEPNAIELLRIELAAAKAEIKDLKYANVTPIENQVLKAPNDWKEAYGDSEKTQIFFNLRALKVGFDQHVSIINENRLIIVAVMDPNDPNSLVSQFGRLQEQVASMQRIFTEGVNVDLASTRIDEQPIIDTNVSPDWTSEAVGWRNNANRTEFRPE